MTVCLCTSRSALWKSSLKRYWVEYARVAYRNYFAILTRTTVLALFFVKSTLLVSQLWSRSLTSHGRWNGLTQTAIANFQPFSAGCETVSHSETCKLKHIRISSWFFGKKKSIFDSFNKYYVPLQVAVFTTEGKTEIFLYLAVVYLGFQSFLSVVAFLRFLRLICANENSYKKLYIRS